MDQLVIQASSMKEYQIGAYFYDSFKLKENLKQITLSETANF